MAASARPGHLAGLRLVAALLAGGPLACSEAAVTKAPDGVLSVAVSPAARTVLQDDTTTFAAAVRNAAVTTVTWSIREGAAGGAISADGTYRAPRAAGTFHVVATADADGLTTGEAVVTVPAVAVAVAPAARTVFVKEAADFTATVTGAVDGSVTWSVLEGAAGGAVTAAGRYTAPATHGTWHVVATANVDHATAGSAQITVPAVAVTVSPRAPSTSPGGTVPFTAAVGNSSDGAVAWTVVEGASGGTVTTAGLYTAPAAAGTYHVRATAHVDGVTQDTVPVTVTAPPAGLQAQLAAVAGKAVFFGHQSVGSNILAGIEALEATVSGGAEPAIVATRSASAMGTGILAENGIGQNLYPVGKIEDFVAVLNGGAGAVVDVALMKFCFLDFFDSAPYWPGGGTPATLFATYQSAMAGLRAAHPGLVLVHVTAPLYQSPTGNETNVRREAYNDLLRAAYAGREPIFDLALVESTHADGTRARDGNGTPTLADEYTYDGGHLNDVGKERAARALLQVLAAIP